MSQAIFFIPVKEVVIPPHDFKKRKKEQMGDK